MIDAILGFIFGMSITGLVWYVKDYCFDCPYLKGYKSGYDKALVDMGKEGNTWPTKN